MEKKKNLNMASYKVQLVQKLKSLNHSLHFRFARWVNEKPHNEVEFNKKSSFRMKFVFILVGAIISGISIFGKENSHVALQKSMQPLRVNS